MPDCKTLPNAVTTEQQKSVVAKQTTPSPEDSKYLAEASKLAKEALPPSWLFRWSPLFSALAGLAVAGTLLYSLWTFREQKIANEEGRFRVATEALGSKETGMRIVGVNMLRRFLDSSRYRDDAVGLMAQLFVFEENEDAVYALADALSAAGQRSPQIFLRSTVPMKERILIKIIYSFSKTEKDTLHRIRQLQDKLYMLGHIEKNVSHRPLVLLKANFQCWRKIDGEFQGSDLAGSSFWRADLYKANFSDASLHDVLLAKANLSYARFDGADLRGANFMGAKLFNTRFEGAKNVSPDTFKKASWAWAHFDADIRKKLELTLGKDGGKEDLREEGKKECAAYQK